MFDYTPENIRANQMDLTVAYLNLIDEKLGKIDRGVRLLTFLGVSLAVIKYKDEIKAMFIKPKGD